MVPLSVPRGRSEKERQAAIEKAQRELKEMGVELMVSVWPTVNRNSPTFDEMSRLGLLAQTERGVPAHMAITDTTPEGNSYVTFYDATNPEARAYLMEKIKKNYIDYGVRVF